ncbi:gamma-glutamyltransferase family protein [Nocardia sp. NPDC052566]|uniref:gamma-glutamyltransferase family protein n=1 Tax=Nocardia sp. NPDC052566 TaxID=3364330 RepID=UPI0037C7D678
MQSLGALEIRCDTSNDRTWNNPFPTSRSPVAARNVAAASHPLATQAALEMLRCGGNAIDAAVAAAITLCVVEPLSTGVGGDAVAMLWDGTRLVGLNASGRAPAGLDPTPFYQSGRMPIFGWDTVTVPGAVSGWVALSERFGVLPFSKLFEPAVRYATDGFVVLPVTARAWDTARGWFRSFPDFGDAFVYEGRTPRAGDLVRLPNLARTLSEIADSKGESLYRGALARRIARHARSGGCALSEADLATHTADWVEPVSVGYRGFVVHELPPNCQGLAALQALGVLDQLPAAGPDADPATALHLRIEATRVAMREARRHIADPAAMVVGADQMLAPDHLAELAAQVDPDRARDHGYRDPHDTGTVCVTTADANGLVVTLVQSLYAGSGIVVPDTGILMHNRGTAFSCDPDHPNQVGPGKRPFSSLAPAFVTLDGRPAFAFGLMGGAVQPQGHVQVLGHLIDSGHNPQAAIDAPRWRIETGLGLAVEPGFDDAALADLTARGHVLVDPAAGGFGAAQLVAIDSVGYLAAADARRDSQAAGF